MNHALKQAMLKISFSYFILFLLFFSAWSATAGAGPLICANVMRPAFKVEDKKVKFRETMDSLKVAAVQFPLAENNKPAAFYAKIENYLLEAHKNGAQLIVFPELITLELIDWTHDEKPQLQKIAAEFSPAYIEWLKGKAQELQVSILGGTTPKLRGQNLVNVAVLAFPDGRVFEQEKIYLTPDEKDWGWSPGEVLRLVNAPWGKTVITTCFDCEFPQISQKLVPYKPEVILVPSWTSSQSGYNRVDWSARARAIEHYAYVIKTGTVKDPTSTQPHFGVATMIGPQDKDFSDEIIEGKPNQPQILYGTLDLKKLRDHRDDSGYNPSLEQTKRKAPFKVESPR